MKKIVTLCAVICAVAVIITAFASCGTKTEDSTTTTTPQIQQSDSDVLSAVIKEKEAIIKKGNAVLQTLSYPRNFEDIFNLNYAKKHNEFVDMNFDGEPDFYIAVNSEDGVVNYYCWLYNATSKEFEFSVILSGLKNISIDNENQLVLSKIVNGDSINVVSYHWVDGELVVKNSYNGDEAEIPEEITKAVEENAIGTDKPTSSSKDDKNETTKKEQTSGDSNKTTKPVKPNKPSNTTTTKPGGNAVVLETGSINSDGWY